MAAQAHLSRFATALGRSGLNGQAAPESVRAAADVERRVAA
jgi:hypothetical protein